MDIIVSTGIIIAMLLLIVIAIRLLFSSKKAKPKTLPRYIVLQGDNGLYYVADKRTVRMDGSIPFIGNGHKDKSDANNEALLLAEADQITE